MVRYSTVILNIFTVNAISISTGSSGRVFVGGLGVKAPRQLKSLAHNMNSFIIFLVFNIRVRRHMTAIYPFVRQ